MKYSPFNSAATYCDSYALYNVFENKVVRAKVDEIVEKL